MSTPSSPYGINVHLPHDNLGVLDRCKEAGIDWVRVDFDWQHIEPRKGSVNWAPCDEVVRKARELGLQIFATLAYSPDWANGGRERQAPPLNSEDWQNFVKRAVGQYGNDIKHWAMWNEPNLAGFFTGSNDDYISRILIPGSEAAKESDPECLIVGPDLAHSGKWGKWQGWMEDILKNAGKNIDIISHHIYKDAPDIFRFLDGTTLPFYEGANLKTVLRDNGQEHKDVWITETGWTTQDLGEGKQASNYEGVLKGIQERDWIKKVFFYEIADDPNWDKKFGIMKTDLTPKQAFFTYQNWITNHPA